MQEVAYLHICRNTRANVFSCTSVN